MSDNISSEPKKTFTLIDFAHAFGLRYASRIFAATNIAAAFLVPVPAEFNIIQKLFFYGIFLYPASTHVADIGAYYVSDHKKPSQSLMQITGRVITSSLFATSVVLIGAAATGNLQVPGCSFLQNLFSHVTPAWLSSIFGDISSFAVQEISETSRQFIKFNFYCGLSYCFCFVSLGHYFRAIPEFLQERYRLLRESAISIATQREKNKSK